MVITGIHPIGQWLSRVACSIRADLQIIMTRNKERGSRSWWPKNPPDNIAVCSQFQDPLQCIDLGWSLRVAINTRALITFQKQRQVLKFDLEIQFSP